MEFSCNRDDKKRCQTLLYFIATKACKSTSAHSVLPYGCQVCHFSLPQYLTLTFERILKRALRIIFGYEVQCSDALSRSGLVTLEQRRTELCKKLFNKIGENPLDILHPLIPFNEGPSKALMNSRS